MKFIRNPQKAWSFAGLFMIMLVLTMPFDAASALAATVQITHNSGEAGIEGFLNAQGDVWTVRAIVDGVADGSIDPSELSIVIGSSSQQFDSCSDSALGTECEYISALSNGIKEDEHEFEVVYTPLSDPTDVSSNGDVIRADGSGPVIQDVTFEQKDGSIDMRFTVEDISDNAQGVGIAQIEIVDGESGEVLQSIGGFEGRVLTYTYDDDSSYDGTLQATFDNEGQKRFKVRATDRLGHVTTSTPFLLNVDFVAPVIKNLVNFTSLGKFIGNQEIDSDVIVYVEDKNGKPTVMGESELLEFSDSTATCSDNDNDDVWECIWKDVMVTPQSSISLTVVAEDESGNSISSVLTQSFTQDASHPQILFFGSERTFEDQSYVGGVIQRIVLRAKDQGVGIDWQDGIKADLAALGAGEFATPNNCVEEANQYECYWSTNANTDSGGVFEIGLSKFEDKVGNVGDLKRIDLIADTVGPKVEKVEVFGVTGNDKRDFLQSGDAVMLTMEIVEKTGVAVLVNMNHLASDATEKFPENSLNRVVGAGWQAFSAEEHCEESSKENTWDCEIITDQIKSGPTSATLEVVVIDTAGNEATWNTADERQLPRHIKSGSSGKYLVDILGSATEDNPDYWEVGEVTVLGGDSNFIDLETTHLTYTRLPFQIQLDQVNENAQALQVELVTCVPPEADPQAAPIAFDPNQNVSASQGAAVPAAPIPPIARTILYEGVDGTGDVNPKPKIIVEFEPFDGRELFGTKEEGFKSAEAKYVCKLRIFSKVKNTAIQNAEEQDVAIVVPFGFTELGAQDENLEKIIEREREAASTGFWGAIGILADLFKWIDYLVQVYNIVTSIIGVVQTAEAGIEPAYQTPAKGGAVAACFGLNGASASLGSVGEALDPVLEVLSCRPTGEGGGELGWYGRWQQSILSLYNIEILKSPDSEGGYAPARDIKQNLYLSVLGLCLPGIVQNLEKYRQVKCRKVACLENEVPAGVATVNQCNELEGLLTCKYFLGELWYVLPFTNLYDGVIGMLQEAFKDPLASLHTLTILGCGIACVSSSSLASSCAYLYYIWDIVGVIESMAGFVTTMIAEFDGGLNYCDSMGLGGF